MTPSFVGQTLVLAASLYLLYKAVRKLPKRVGYAVYSLIGALALAIILIGVYRPEWLEAAHKYI